MTNLLSRFAVALVVFPIAAFAASSITLQYTTYNPANLSGTVTVNPGQSLNLETGAAVSSGGDFSWDGKDLTPLGKAIALDVTAIASVISGAGGYALVTQAELQALLSNGSAAPFTPAQNDVIGARDNSGNYAKMLVTSLAGLRRTADRRSRRCRTTIATHRTGSRIPAFRRARFSRFSGPGWPILRPAP